MGPNVIKKFHNAKDKMGHLYIQRQENKKTTKYFKDTKIKVALGIRNTTQNILKLAHE
jgi:hypothetical protein